MIERDECLLRKVAKEREREEDKESVRFWTYLCFIHNKEDVKIPLCNNSNTLLFVASNQMDPTLTLHPV